MSLPKKWSIFFAKVNTTLKMLSRKQKIVISVLTILFVLCAVCTFALLRVNNSVGKTFQGSTLKALTAHDPLKQDANGITNTLIFGNSSDDPGHGGALLADSIIVLSVNNKTKSAHTVSIPRDLWVQYGKKCSNGTEGKINAVYQCALRQNGGDEQKAGEAFGNQVGDILGIPVQYYVKVNYTFVRDTVNALGGIEVTIHSDDPRGILDRTFDTHCPNGPYTCYNVKYPNGLAQLNGQQALDLSRARNAKGGYGLPRSNFDREINQQMIIQAIQKKALSKGILENPIKAISLVNSLGNNITTDIRTSEIQSALDTLRAVKPGAITSIPLNAKTNPLVTTGMQGNQSIVLPVLGLYNYSALRSAMQKELAL